jgi:hypothetical protein
MASFTFGSVGDIIAICQIRQSTVSALNDARGSAAEYQVLGRSLANLFVILENVIVSVQGYQYLAAVLTVLLQLSERMFTANEEIGVYGLLFFRGKLCSSDKVLSLPILDLGPSRCDSTGALLFSRTLPMEL